MNSYLFNIPEDDDSFSIRILSKDNAVIGEAEKNDKNLYVYHKFTINPSDRPDIRGMFKYGNLPANDVTLNLLDDALSPRMPTQKKMDSRFRRNDRTLE